jgi:hypothetical protein
MQSDDLCLLDMTIHQRNKLYEDVSPLNGTNIIY